MDPEETEVIVKVGVNTLLGLFMGAHPPLFIPTPLSCPFLKSSLIAEVQFILQNPDWTCPLSWTLVGTHMGPSISVKQPIQQQSFPILVLGKGLGRAR